MVSDGEAFGELAAAFYYGLSESKAAASAALQSALRRFERRTAFKASGLASVSESVSQSLSSRHEEEVDAGPAVGSA